MNGGCALQVLALNHGTLVTLLAIYIANPNTVVMQYIVLFSHRTVRLPSVVLSHQHDAAVCNPAPARTRSITTPQYTSVC